MLNQLFVNMTVFLNTSKAGSQGVYFAVFQKLYFSYTFASGIDGKRNIAVLKSQYR